MDNLSVYSAFINDANISYPKFWLPKFFIFGKILAFF